ncbi:sporulation integral membrane protein YlbJ [Lederbergia citrisecunda]
MKTILLASGVTIMACSMILFPKESFSASIRGLNMWWEIVFPSLFPFFVISELLIGFGVVKFMGVLLEPLMRPLFRVPGVGGFAWAMGMATGFPAGAKLSARLRQERQLSRVEAERLVSFTNSSSPLFIFGAVSVGFFLNPRLGILFAFAHYLGNFLVGICMRFYGEKEKRVYRERRSPWKIFSHALSELHRTRIMNKQPIGKLLGDAVISSVQTLLMIGGFIILFSVINKLLYQLNITFLLAGFTEYILKIFHLPQELGVPIIAGIFEITLGSQMASQVNEANLMHQAMITSFILGFSGFSVQAQVASIIALTDIKFKPFFMARILHGFLAAGITFLLWKPFAEKLHIVSGNNVIPVMLQEHDLWWEYTLNLFVVIGPIITILSLMIYTYLLVKKMDSTNV